MTTPPLPELRQLVLLTGDLELSLKTARTRLGVPTGLRDAEDMERLGMVHEVVGFDRTYIEILQPTNPDSGMGKRVTKGDSGFMLVVQVDDSDAMVARARSLGLEPLFVKDHHGNRISQWHPRDFGTIAEFDQINPSNSWHFAPAVYEARSTSMVEDIVSIELRVTDPIAMAQRWATVIGATMCDDGQSIAAGNRTIRFVNTEGPLGIRQVECRATHRESAGETFELAGVLFSLV